MYASARGFHAGVCILPRSTATPTDGTCDRPMPATTLDGIFEISGGEEILVLLAAHLRAHAVEAVARDGAQLEHPVDVEARVDQPAEVAVPDQLFFLFSKIKAGHVGLFVLLVGGAVLRTAERAAHLVQAVAPLRGPQVEDGG